MMTPDVYDLRLGLDRSSTELKSALDYALLRRRDLMADQNRALRQLSPLTRVRTYRQRIDDWGLRLTSSQRGRLRLLRERVEARERALVAASPQAILERGYAMVSDAATGKRITSAAQVGERINVQFRDGSIGAKVEHD